MNKKILENIEVVLTDIKERNPVMLKANTPKIFLTVGLKDLPMYENPSHIRKNILSEKEAKSLGLKIGSNDHYHALGKELYITAINSLDNPLVILKSKLNNDYIAITETKNNKGIKIMIPIDINATTIVNRVKINNNRVKSVYGKEEIYKYIQNRINSGNFDLVYTKKDSWYGSNSRSKNL